jgi:DNA-binding CsgD family transcriptional regulator/tetratricopeptide (TPR) repeat protein
LLLDLFRAGKTSQHGSTIVVSGEAGIGKSRLIRELTDFVRRERCLVLEGSCLEYLSTPFAPFVDALRKDPAGAHLEEELRRVEPARVASADLERRRRFELVEKHLRRRAAVEGAILLTIEDLHWCDAASIDLLRFLLSRLRQAPVLIVTTYRNDDPHAGRAPLIGTLARDGATVLELEPLNDRHIAELLRSTARRSSLSDIDLERIEALAEGRPLVAEELLRAAVDGAIPTSIRSGILERFWALDEPARDVLCTAAVIGRSFDVGLLERVIDGGRAPILATLRKARNLQLIVEDDDALMRFRHAITREILYGELLTAEVRPRHSRTAHALEAESPPRLDEAAYHWAAANDSARAVDANDAAGDRATAIYAYGDAARFYERAVRFAAGKRRVAVIEKLAFALCAVGKMEAARMWCEEGSTLLEALDEYESALRLKLWIARQFYESGEVERAFGAVDAVRAALDSRPTARVRATADTTLAAMLATVGRAQDALDLMATLDEDECESDPVDGFRLHNARGIALFSLGQYDEAQRSYARAAAWPGITDELRLYAKINGGNASLNSGETEMAEQAYDEARTLADRGGFERHKAMVASSLALVALYRGQLSEALRWYLAVIENASAVAMTVGFAHAVGIRLLGFLGSAPPLAELDVMRVADEAFRLRESQTAAIVCGAAAQLLLDRGETERASTLIRRAFSVVTVPDYAYWPESPAVQQARGLLVSATANGANRPALAHLRLFDARCSEHAQARESAAREAATMFERIGWPLEAAAAYAVAGDAAAASELRVRCGVVRDAPASDRYRFSPRERAVAQLAARGYTSREIGAALNIGERTVETHLSRVFRKTGVRTRIELAARLR